MTVRHDLWPSWGFSSIALSALLLAACPRPELPERDGGDRSAADDKASGDAQKAEPKTVGYEPDGALVASRLKSIVGAAIPRGFKRIHSETGRSIYVGPAPGEKVLKFYQEHLDCAKVEKLGRGWKFHDASPKGGAAGRTLNVLVIKEGTMETRVILADTTMKVGVKRPEGEKRPTYEELYKAAHQGKGSVKTPIPGTY